MPHGLYILTSQPHPHGKAAVEKVGVRVMSIWQGQKDLVSPAGSGAAPWWGAPSTDRGGSRDRRSRAPLALAHPSARGFGVDVGESTRERGRGGVGRFLLQVTKRAVLGWCCEEISGPKGRENPGKAGNTLTRIDKDRIIKVPGLLPAGRLLQTGG